jgi:hypothetical protein
MTTETTSPSPAMNAGRPLGVTLFCTYAVLLEGLYPASAMTLFISAGLRAPTSHEATALLSLLVARLIIALGVIVSSILAFRGANAARLFLLALVTLGHILAIQNLPLLLVGPMPHQAIPGLVLGMLKQAVVPAAFIWYFSRRQTRAFYQPSAAPTDTQAPG